MKPTIPTGWRRLTRRALYTSAFFALSFPAIALADIHFANEPPHPPTPRDIYNASVGYTAQCVLLVIAAVSCAWLMGWGIRMRRRWTDMKNT